MKKYLNIAFVYAIAAMVGGVFYREFTKWQGFDGVTALERNCKKVVFLNCCK